MTIENILPPASTFLEKTLLQASHRSIDYSLLEKLTKTAVINKFVVDEHGAVDLLALTDNMERLFEHLPEDLVRYQEQRGALENHKRIESLTTNAEDPVDPIFDVTFYPLLHLVLMSSTVEDAALYRRLEGIGALRQLLARLKLNQPEQVRVFRIINQLTNPAPLELGRIPISNKIISHYVGDFRPMILGNSILGYGLFQEFSGQKLSRYEYWSVTQYIGREQPVLMSVPSISEWWSSTTRVLIVLGSSSALEPELSSLEYFILCRGRLAILHSSAGAGCVPVNEGIWMELTDDQRSATHLLMACHLPKLPATLELSEIAMFYNPLVPAQRAVARPAGNMDIMQFGTLLAYIRIPMRIILDRDSLLVRIALRISP